MSGRVAIVGPDQAGLKLGFTLLENGHSASLVKDKPGADITATASLFERSQKSQQAVHVNFWEGLVFPSREIRSGAHRAAPWTSQTASAS